MECSLDRVPSHLIPATPFRFMQRSIRFAQKTSDRCLRSFPPYNPHRHHPRFSRYHPQRDGSDLRDWWWVRTC